MEDCPKPRGHWPHTYYLDGVPNMCTGKGVGKRIFWSWPTKVVHLISDLRKLKTVWRAGGS